MQDGRHPRNFFFLFLDAAAGRHAAEPLRRQPLLRRCRRPAWRVSLTVGEGGGVFPFCQSWGKEGRQGRSYSSKRAAGQTRMTAAFSANWNAAVGAQAHGWPPLLASPSSFEVRGDGGVPAVAAALASPSPRQTSLGLPSRPPPNRSPASLACWHVFHGEEIKPSLFFHILTVISLATATSNVRGTFW